ncbi:MAG: glycoside hydrolase family 57 [Myxococcota bacterium]
METSATQAWAIFYLNLMFSSIEEERRLEVIQKCYWPLLRVIEETGFPSGISMAGYTLSEIGRLDPAWIAALKNLMERGLVEFIAAGQFQIIGPLVPNAVNRANYRLGNTTYRNILNQVPKLVLVNEQCFSNSMIDHYIDAGYQGFIMDWDNIQLANPGLNPLWRHAPQIAVSASGRLLPVLWDQSIAFQKFQRFVHGLDSQDLYDEWLNRYLQAKPAAISIYCNDVEIFDFRPGRFVNEPIHTGPSEWIAIGKLLSSYLHNSQLKCVLPHKLLTNCNAKPETALKLTTAAMPIPTKKQEHYNVLRWAVSGRDNIHINSRCLALARALDDSKLTEEPHWEELCYLYASDFRTHITERRWQSYLQRLASFESRWIKPNAYNQ